MKLKSLSYIVINIGVLCVLAFPFIVDNTQNSKSEIVIRFDDYGIWCSDDWISIEEKLIDLHEKYNVKISFGVVPKSIYPASAHPKTMAFYPSKSKQFITSYNAHPLTTDSRRVEILKLSNQMGVSEICQHGYYHPKYYSNTKNGEFFGYDYDIQYFKIKDGKNILDSLFNSNICVFIPPHNTYDGMTLNLLQECGFEFVSAKDVDFNSPQDDALELAYLPFTTEYFEPLIEKYEANKGLTSGPSPTDVLLLHHTSFTNKDGIIDNDKIGRYEYFLSLIKKYGINNYHISEAASNTYLLNKNYVLRKHLYGKLSKIAPSSASIVLEWSNSRIVSFVSIFCIWLFIMAYGLSSFIAKLLIRKKFLTLAKKITLTLTICSFFLLIYQIQRLACFNIEICFNRLFSTPLFASIIFFSLFLGALVSVQIELKNEK